MTYVPMTEFEFGDHIQLKRREGAKVFGIVVYTETSFASPASVTSYVYAGGTVTRYGVKWSDGSPISTYEAADLVLRPGFVRGSATPAKPEPPVADASPSTNQVSADLKIGDRVYATDEMAWAGFKVMPAGTVGIVASVGEVFTHVQFEGVNAGPLPCYRRDLIAIPSSQMGKRGFDFGDVVIRKGSGSSLWGIVYFSPHWNTPVRHEVFWCGGNTSWHTADELQYVDTRRASPFTPYQLQYDKLLRSMLNAYHAAMAEPYRHIERAYNDAADAFCEYVATNESNVNAPNGVAK